MLSNINSREGGVVNNGNKFMLEITSDDDARVAVIDVLRYGGYYLTAYYYYRAEDLLKAATFEEDLAIYRSKRPTQPIFPDDDDCVAHLRVLPKDFADMPKERLVKALYEGAENAYHQLVGMHEWDDYIELVSAELSSVAIFKAAWRDHNKARFSCFN